MSLAMGLLFGGFAGYGAMQTSANPRNIMVSLGWWMFHRNHNSGWIIYNC
jgi:hypothetical protein